MLEISVVGRRSTTDAPNAQQKSRVAKKPIFSGRSWGAQNVGFRVCVIEHPALHSRGITLQWVLGYSPSVFIEQCSLETGQSSSKVYTNPEICFDVALLALIPLIIRLNDQH
jgi:hypothetical protein